MVGLAVLGLTAGTTEQHLARHLSAPRVVAAAPMLVVQLGLVVQRVAV